MPIFKIHSVEILYDPSQRKDMALIPLWYYKAHDTM